MKPTPDQVRRVHNAKLTMSIAVKLRQAQERQSEVTLTPEEVTVLNGLLLAAVKAVGHEEG